MEKKEYQLFFNQLIVYYWCKWNSQSNIDCYCRMIVSNTGTHFAYVKMKIELKNQVRKLVTTFKIGVCSKIRTLFYQKTGLGPLNALYPHTWL